MQELEALKNELEDSTNTTAAAEVLRTKREQEVIDLKKSLDEEVHAHETAVQEMRRKYTQQLEEAAEALDQAKKVISAWADYCYAICRGFFFRAHSDEKAAIVIRVIRWIVVIT